MSGARQLPLDLGLAAALGGEDFLVAACNADAVAWIDRWPAWPAPGLVVHGAAGCGKTHLAHVFAARAGAPLIAAAALTRAGPPDLLAGRRAVVVEDADRPGGDAQALLHLYNLAREQGAQLLLTARLPAAQWRTTLPDLASRLRALPHAAILPPDDSLLAGLLVKLFADRQLRVGQEVVAYLLARLERSCEALRAAVAAIDAAALAERREVTVPLVRKVVEGAATPDRPA